MRLSQENKRIKKKKRKEDNEQEVERKQEEEDKGKKEGWVRRKVIHRDTLTNETVSRAQSGWTPMKNKMMLRVKNTETSILENQIVFIHNEVQI